MTAGRLAHSRARGVTRGDGAGSERSDCLTRSRKPGTGSDGRRPQRISLRYLIHSLWPSSQSLVMYAKSSSEVIPSTLVPTICAHARQRSAHPSFQPNQHAVGGGRCAHQVEAPRVLVGLDARHAVALVRGAAAEQDLEPALEPLPPVPLLQRVDDAQPVLARPLEQVGGEGARAVLLLPDRVKYR